MANKKITIDQLAVMINNGFEKTATKDQLFDVEKKFEKRFNDVDKRFDKIENILFEDQNKKIEKLEMRIEYLENSLNLPSKK